MSILPPEPVRAPVTAPFQIPAAANAPHAAPFLHWPVSRREFYRSIAWAIAPALLWGVIIYGIRPLLMLLSAGGICTFMHLLLKRWLPWQRGKSLIYMHSFVSTLVLVALADPLWPVWAVAAVAVLLPVILALIGGPGKERVHVAVALAFCIQFALLPFLPRLHTYAGGPPGILARDRLFMGDIREQRTAPIDPWPASRQLEGADAVRMPHPARAAADAFDQLSRKITGGDTYSPPTDLETLALSRKEELAFRQLFIETLAFRLPPMQMQLLGAVPGRVGTVSLIAMVLAGLYLAYRFILRPKSVVLYLLAFVLGSALFAFSPPALAAVSGFGVFNLLKLFPGELATLFEFLLLNSDAAFAGVIILALPGTEPLTPRGRRIFLVTAGLLGAALHHLHPSTPCATLALCALMPAAPLFDRSLSRRSWLNARP